MKLLYVIVRKSGVETLKLCAILFAGKFGDAYVGEDSCLDLTRG